MGTLVDRIYHDTPRDTTESAMRSIFPGTISHDAPARITYTMYPGYAGVMARNIRFFMVDPSITPEDRADIREFAIHDLERAGVTVGRFNTLGYLAEAYERLAGERSDVRLAS